MTPYQAMKRIEQAFAHMETSYELIASVLRERPDLLPSDMVQDQHDAQVAWHRQTNRMLAHVTAAYQAHKQEQTSTPPARRARGEGAER